MKKILRILSKITLSVVITFIALSQISQRLTEKLDTEYLEKSRDSSLSLVVPSVKGNAMGMDTLYSLNTRVKTPKVVQLGNSTSLAGVIDPSYTLLNASIGSATLESMTVMLNYLRLKDVVINDEDVLKLDVSPTSFQKRNINQDILVSALEYGNNYIVNKNLEVEKGKLNIITEPLSKGSRFIVKGLEYLKTLSLEQSLNSLYSTNYQSFKGYEKTFDLSDKKLDVLKKILQDYKDKAIVVELMYQHPDFINSEAGRIYNDYVNKSVIPLLNSFNIMYLDHREILDENYFIDNNHLNYQGRIEYTNKLNEVFKEGKYVTE